MRPLRSNERRRVLVHPTTNRKKGPKPRKIAIFLDPGKDHHIPKKKGDFRIQRLKGQALRQRAGEEKSRTRTSSPGGDLRIGKRRRALKRVRKATTANEAPSQQKEGGRPETRVGTRKNFQRGGSREGPHPLRGETRIKKVNNRRPQHQEKISSARGTGGLKEQHSTTKSRRKVLRTRKKLLQRKVEEGGSGRSNEYTATELSKKRISACRDNLFSFPLKNPLKTTPLSLQISQKGGNKKTAPQTWKNRNSRNEWRGKIKRKIKPVSGLPPILRGFSRQKTTKT